MLKNKAKEFVKRLGRNAKLLPLDDPVFKESIRIVFTVQSKNSLKKINSKTKVK
tara:strand:- start:1181 stop:1342 length:162 start_codon:yes stop_codon:yes gene_type:complete